MQLKLRPMSEAPLNAALVVRDVELPTGWDLRVFASNGATRPARYSGFYELSDLLRAADIVAAITPEGYEYERGCAPVYTRDGSAEVLVIFKPIAPPVEYEYVTDLVERIPNRGEWYRSNGELFEAQSDEECTPRLCFRRVEVKR